MTSLVTTKTDTDVRPHVLMFVNSAQDHSIHRMRKIKYIAKNVTGTALTKTASPITVMFARRFINAKTAIRLNLDLKNTCVFIHVFATVIKLLKKITINPICNLKKTKMPRKPYLF